MFYCKNFQTEQKISINCPMNIHTLHTSSDNKHVVICICHVSVHLATSRILHQSSWCFWMYFKVNCRHQCTSPLNPSARTSLEFNICLWLFFKVKFTLHEMHKSQVYHSMSSAKCMHLHNLKSYQLTKHGHHPRTLPHAHPITIDLTVLIFSLEISFANWRYLCK